MDKEFDWEQQKHNKELYSESEDNESEVEDNESEDYKMFDVQEYEIINSSDSPPINFRKMKLTWNEYFKKLYNISLIIVISTIVYFYYIYGKTNTTNNELSKF
jgi:hypothetical protein